MRFRTTLARFATGVTFVTADVDGRPRGMVANSFMSVSLVPPLVAFCPSRRSTTWPYIEGAERFGVNLLGRQHIDLCRARAQPGADRFAGLSYDLSRTGVPVLEDALAFLACSLEDVHPAGDHWIAVGRVCDVAIAGDMEPLVFYGHSYGTFANDAW
jgi:flavin reductase (DIM6/NTAB) family NADH-FMN oxidoreductase RutF